MNFTVFRYVHISHDSEVCGYFQECFRPQLWIGVIIVKGFI